MPLASLPPGQQDDAIRSQLANAGAVLPLGKTLPRVAHGYAGSIDAVAVTGRQLQVTGWTPTIGPGRKIVFTGFAPEAQARLEELASTERPDIVQAYQRPDMLQAGFRATLGFADEASARAASQALCALVTGHLPGQEHQFLLLPVQGQKRCGNVLIPAPSTMEQEQG